MCVGVVQKSTREVAGSAEEQGGLASLVASGAKPLNLVSLSLGGVDVRSRPCGVAAWLLDYVMLLSLASRLLPSNPVNTQQTL